MPVFQDSSRVYKCFFGLQLPSTLLILLHRSDKLKDIRANSLAWVSWCRELILADNEYLDRVLQQSDGELCKQYPD